ncbi:DUF6298 domain-containing protein [Pontibacter beigongshangensis]|uniref:DUF6298 domain-containing protein n=1 Tax=Pontibacter beigongshangensis TaxID=2574733 RepID=UPI001650BC47|nr:DUF6298 domain-containing protein [Pontibacter beigongshangensis]
MVLWLLAGSMAMGNTAWAQTKKAPPVPPVAIGKDGRLAYAPDSLGNRVPDFSYSGYMAGEQAIPDAPVKVVVPVQQGDATRRIQAALDHVATLPADPQGIRGAVLLEKGTYEVLGSLRITASGVVLRGSGEEEGGTVLLGSGLTRETLVTVAGKYDRQLKPAVKITDNYVPVNATKVRVAAAGTFKPGDKVLVHRPSTKEWIQKLQMEEFGGETGYIGWKPGERDIYWDRTVVAVEGSTVTLDAPITTALDATYGGGNLIAYTWPGRISQVGVENMRLQSTYDKSNPKDEAHRWMAITMENVQDAWVRQIIFKHFAGSAVAAFETAKRVTVEDCKSLAPVSEIGGQRRYTFYTTGQQTLFQRLYAEDGYHDFAVGFMAAGPNAFVQCVSYLPHSFSGAIDSWASGVLFDIVDVDGQALSFKNRYQDAQGAGWAAANSVFWQSTAARIDNYAPPTATNWAFGAWSQFGGDGYWGSVNSHVKPRSLYYAQLSDRLGEQVMARAHLLPMETNATSSPTVEQAMELTRQAVEPAPQLKDWIEKASERVPIPVQTSKVKTIDQIGIKNTTPAKLAAPMQVRNGWLVRGNAIVTGKRQDVPWWRGDIRYYEQPKAKPAVTRYVAGRTGPGLTDNLEEVTDSMAQRGVVALEHNYGLWYERRRDDHERVRRMDGEVWAPFYEQPFARSGEGTAWDGLSKYDLTKFNHWYWSRLKQFADLADQKGLVLVHQNYFQHNIIEAGAHWSDSPWRPANNINETGFPEPPPYAGDKRIFMAEQFYDTTHPIRRELHRTYIRKCLDNFADNTGVIQLVSAEYTGPLHFVEFWIDTILEWEKETGKNALVGLSTTKDVQDAILGDPARAAAIDLIDIRYWGYREDGSVYAPQGGVNLAPRQHARKMKVGKRSAEQVYRAVREYRQKHLDKAVIYSEGNYDAHSWAVFMAGGSLAAIPPTTPAQFLADAATMLPVDIPGSTETQFTLGKSGKGYIIYSDSGKQLKLDLSKDSGTYKMRWLDPKTGKLLKKEERLKGGKLLNLSGPNSGPAVLWVTK